MTRTHGDRIHIAIGIGETFAAIDGLIAVIARERISVSDDLVAAVTAWLDCHVGQDAEPRLRELLTEVKVSPAPQTPEADTLRKFLATATAGMQRRSSL